MMKEKNEKSDYIVCHLKKMHKKYGYLSFEYAICRYTGFHMIEVSPYNDSMCDIEYVKEENNFNDMFTKMYPEEDLYFSEPCTLNDMGNNLTILKI